MSVYPDRTSIKKILIVTLAQLLVGRPSSTFVISTSITPDTLNSIKQFEIFLKKSKRMSYLYTSERSQMYNRQLYFVRVAGGLLRASQPPLAFHAKGGSQFQNLPDFEGTPLDRRVKGVWA